MIIAFLFIYFLLAFYVSYNGWVWLKNTYSFSYKKTYFITMFFVSISFFLSQFIHFQLLTWIGYLWLVIFGYGLLLFPILNLIYYLNKKRGLKWFGYSMVAFYLFVFSYGSYNMWSPVVVSYDIELKKETDIDELKILMVSDIHISETIGNRFINRLINLSNQVEPDIIFLAGDVLDNSIDPYLKHNIGETLAGLTAPMGVYAVLGNHEYYGNDIPIFIREMNEINVTVLVDEVYNFNDLFYIVGRKDYSDLERQEIALLTNDLEKDKPIFLIDHQPREFDEVSAAGVDLMVSGHTHKGQLFPGNLITNAIYENHHGYLLKDELHTIVSSGYGIWGPPFRIGSRSEVIEINISFVE
ncbi:metallophosphoesterase [Anaerobacillus alkaliphilus]|nr:metallophosphoesterase [Anaerobacillus alkaliphilus]